MFRELPWRWIIPVLLIAALAFTARAYAGALGRADAAAVDKLRLIVRLQEVEYITATLEDALAEADTVKAELARVNSARIGELEREGEGLERTVRELKAAGRWNAEGVDVALRDLGAVLSPGALPALNRLTSAYEVRITGLSDQVVALTGIVDVRGERIEILEGELAAERFARGLADAVSSGLRNQLAVQGEIVKSQEVEIDALRDAVAPGFFLRLSQNAELAGVAAVFGGVVVFLTTSGG